MGSQGDLDRTLRDRIVSSIEELAGTSTDVGVAVHDGAVTVCGEVDSHPAKTALVARVLGVDGVDCMVDRLSVAQRCGQRPDEDIARDVARVLRDSDLVPTHAVRATVRDGVVTLTGSVSWAHQRDDTARLVRRVAGVRATQNSVRVDRGPSSLTPLRAGPITKG